MGPARPSCLDSSKCTSRRGVTSQRRRRGGDQSRAGDWTPGGLREPHEGSADLPQNLPRWESCWSRCASSSLLARLAGLGRCGACHAPVERDAGNWRRQRRVGRRWWGHRGAALEFGNYLRARTQPPRLLPYQLHMWLVPGPACEPAQSDRKQCARRPLGRLETLANQSSSARPHRRRHLQPRRSLHVTISRTPFESFVSPSYA